MTGVPEDPKLSSLLFDTTVFGNKQAYEGVTNKLLASATLFFRSDWTRSHLSHSKDHIFTELEASDRALERPLCRRASI